MSVKADATVRKSLRAVRRLIEDPDTDLITKRIAYEIECAIRWAREDGIQGWPSPVQMAVDAGTLLKQELAQAQR
jgi:hypothetical protein